MITHYCNYEAGVRNLRKCIDRIFRKTVSEIETTKVREEAEAKEAALRAAVEEIGQVATPGPFEESQQEETPPQEEESSIPPKEDPDAAELTFIPEAGEIEVKPIQYEINTKNLEKYLDIPSTDDYYFEKINQALPVGCSNGLAYINDGNGSVLKIQFVKKDFGGKGGEIT